MIELPGEGPEAEAAPIITEDTEAAQDLPPVRPGKRRRQPRARASPKSDSGADEAMEDVDDGVSLYKISAEDNAGGEPTLFDAVVQGIDKCFDELSSSRKGLTLSNTLNKLYFDFRFPSYKGGASEIYNAPSHKVPPQEFLHYYSQALLEALDKKYKPTEFYASLKELAKMPLRPAAFKLSDFPLPLIPRKSMPRVSKKTEQVPSTPVTGRDSDASESGIRPRGKRPMRPGKTSALRPKTAASKKRPRSELESGSDTESSSNMRSQFFSGDEDSSMADAAALETEEATEPKTGVQYDLEPIKLVIRAEKAPDSSPRGPHDTWTCNQDGCDYVVRGGDEAECQTRIQAHFHDHEEQQDRVTLAVAESRGHMPIKYAYFPPFLILVEFPPETNTSPNTKTLHSSSTNAHLPNSPSAHDKCHLTTPTPLSSVDETSRTPGSRSGLTGEAFRRMVEQFRRPPHRVSDKMDFLTLQQSPTRKAQTNGRAIGAGAQPDVGGDDGAD